MLELKENVTTEQVDVIRNAIAELGLRSRLVKGTMKSTIQVIGDETGIDLHSLAGLPGVEKVTPVNAPYKLSSRRLHPEYGLNGHSRIVNVSGVEFGGDKLVIIGGPCAVYNEEQTVETARAAKEAGVDMLRGGAYKPRTSPPFLPRLGR